jgi:CPA1 family monovalent cation:H+ antiporter
VGDIEFLFVLLFASAVLVRLADLARIPYPIVLVLGGLGIALLPGLPELELDPDVVFLVFLPPLLHSAAWRSSPRVLLAERKPLILLALGLVLVTMGVVAVIAHEVVGLSWEAAFVLGAIVAPTDPASAAATFSRLGVPERVALMVEGEAMLNDAAALTAYRVAVTAAVAGSFSVVDAGLDFVLSAVGGVAVGLAIGWFGGRIQQRLADVPLSIVLSLVFAYGAYIAGEELGVSGVLGTVTAGLWLSWHASQQLDADTRLSAFAFWEVLIFLLNALLFLLLGLQFPGIVDQVNGMSTGTLLGYVAVVSAVVVAVRLAVVFLPHAVPLLREADAGETWRERLIIGWSGMRGAISLAAALSIPTTLDSGAPFADRGLVIFLTVGVIAVTLVGQGLTLGPLVRALGLHGERPWTPDEAIARLEAAQAALDRLEELEKQGMPEEHLQRLRDLYRARFRRCMAVIGGEDDPGVESPNGRVSFGRLRRDLIGAERDALLRLRREGKVGTDLMRTIERDLDLEEARLRV